MTDVAMVVVVVAVVVGYLAAARHYQRTPEARKARSLQQFAGRRVTVDVAEAPGGQPRGSWQVTVVGVDHVDGERRLLIRDPEPAPAGPTPLEEPGGGIPLANITGVLGADGRPLW